MYQNTSKFPGELSQNCARTHTIPGGRNIIRTDQIFQEILSKVSLEHIKFSRKKKYHKNRSNFPRELSLNFVFFLDFPGDHTPKTRYFVKLPRRMLSTFYRLAFSKVPTQKKMDPNIRLRKVEWIYTFHRDTFC